MIGVYGKNKKGYWCLVEVAGYQIICENGLSWWKWYKLKRSTVGVIWIKEGSL